MTTATEAARRCAKRIKSQFAVHSESDRWTGCGTDELASIIAAEFAPLVAELEQLRAEFKTRKDAQVH